MIPETPVSSPGVLKELRTCRWDAPAEGEAGAPAEDALGTLESLYRRPLV